ncbi:MAG: DUF86 domain-containing protein [Magnetococcales bacterium]|nr:DUF86 domain-containing protein [Magnetococcales bacterium]
MLHEDVILLQHILDAATDAVQFLDGRTVEELHADRMRLFAIIRCLEVIGEAAGDLSPACRQQAHWIPWSGMIAMRNRLIHGYFDVDPVTVWHTVADRLPELITHLKILSDAWNPDARFEPDRQNPP